MMLAPWPWTRWLPPTVDEKNRSTRVSFSQAPRVCPRSSVVGIDPVDTMLGEISLSTSPPRQVKCSRGGGDRVRGSGAKRPRCSTQYSRTRGSLPSQPACKVPSTPSSLFTLEAAVVDMAMARPGVNMACWNPQELENSAQHRFPASTSPLTPGRHGWPGWQKGGQLCRHSDVYPRALIGAGRRCDTYPAFYHAHLGLGRAREGLRLPTYPCLDVGVFLLGAVLCCVAALCHAILRASSPGTGLAAMAGGHLDMSGQP